ncbi:sodium- and chloride-dependent neutral and basic amino acid transporter B(0+)-like [Diadema antillarum]|uniref:sodium- and chloride-dependent neutral and basic amino acid transporter B(0+)-like n=1 Tax=Diadema antillarum TaxID=105358 RepID=UPI003A89133F
MGNPDDDKNGVIKPKTTAPTPSAASLAYLPPGVSLSGRNTPASRAPVSGRSTPSHLPASGRSSPSYFRPISGRSSPDSLYSASFDPSNRPRTPSRTDPSVPRPPTASSLSYLPAGVSLSGRPTPVQRYINTSRPTPVYQNPPPVTAAAPPPHRPTNGRSTPSSINSAPDAKPKKPPRPYESTSRPRKEETTSSRPRSTDPPASKPPSRRPSEGGVSQNGKDKSPDDEDKEFKGDENEERGNWTNKMDFVLSCLGYAVGLGNVWRFPYLAYRNGGGAFLIPYVIMLFFAGLPLFLMEVSFGQYCSLGPISMWRCVPLMRGVGYCQMVTAAYVGIYYNVIIMYTIYYFFASFTSELPWTGCENAWNTPACYDLYDNCIDNGGIVVHNGSCLALESLDDATLSYYNITHNLGGFNISAYVDPMAGRRELASEQYWKNAVLQEAPTMNEPGGVIWQLALCLLVAWIIVYACLVKGIKSSGKVVYFTATFPYAVLFILLIRGATLPGAGNGIRFFVIPDFSRLSDARVWRDAAIQIFYSLSAAGGGLVTLASYNKFHNNSYGDSMFVAIANCCTSVFAGFVIFSIVGFMAHELNQPVETVVQQGFGLAFIAYPAAVARMPVSPLWSLLFFGMLITLGLDSQFAIMENLVTALVDEFPQLRKRKPFVLLGACAIMYFLGFSCITHTGSYWVSHLDSYGAFFNYLVYALLECVALAWIYGVKRLVNDIRTMCGDKWIGHWSFMWWPMNWAAFTPALMLFVLMFNFLNWEEPSYNGPFPTWAVAVGWLITLCSLIWIPVVIIYEFVMTPGSLWERWDLISNPEDVWGPALSKFRLEAWKVHHKNGTTMGGRLDIDGSGRRWYPGDIQLDDEEEENEEVIIDAVGGGGGDDGRPRRRERNGDASIDAKRNSESRIV